LLPSTDLTAIRKNLLRWFAKARRTLPWRADRDPYRIWVSEVMLQQTLVATVVPYFERFLTQFPTVADLAAADEQDVLRVWEGLGYYRRARNLHQAAKIIVAEHEGRFPIDPAAAVQLPGIGRYMLGAIFSQAFDAPMAIIEANSQRVLCRLFARKDDPRSGAARTWLWEAAQALVPHKHAGDFNQALMELGALVCSPRDPNCSECPLKKMCQAHQLGIQGEIPPPAKRPVPRLVSEAAIVLSKTGKLFIAQRPGTGRWANMWEFPHGVLQPGETHEQAARRLLGELTGMQGEIGKKLLKIKHAVTHHQITLVCFEAAYRKGRFVSEFYQKGEWVDPTNLGNFPVSSPQRRLARFLVQDHRQTRLF
jgi:A/G-specific adenine glycosylase